MPIRMSRKGWNNVLIFSCMFMILLFNYTSNMFSGNRQAVEQRTLINNEGLLQALDFSGIELQRVGTGWRVLSQLKLNTSIKPEGFIQAWTDQPLESLPSEPLVLQGAKSFPVVAWVAGQLEGLVYEFVINHQEQAVYVHDKKQNQWLAMPYNQLTHFIPEALIDA